jgi:TRAP-type C4-dicarboxylate transport system substrate-binding protein
MQSVTRTIRSASLAAVAALALSAPALLSTTAEAATWRYAFEEAMEDVQGKFAQKFKEEVEKNSDHTVKLFPFGTLGESADIMEQAQAGILQFVDQSPGFTGSLIPVWPTASSADCPSCDQSIRRSSNWLMCSRAAIPNSSANAC